MRVGNKWQIGWQCSRLSFVSGTESIVALDGLSARVLLFALIPCFILFFRPCHGVSLFSCCFVEAAVISAVLSWVRAAELQVRVRNVRNIMCTLPTAAYIPEAKLEEGAAAHGHSMKMLQTIHMPLPRLDTRCFSRHVLLCCQWRASSNVPLNRCIQVEHPVTPVRMQPVRVPFCGRTPSCTSLPNRRPD